MVRARDKLRHSSEPSLLVLGFGSGNGAEQIKHANGIQGIRDPY